MNNHTEKRVRRQQKKATHSPQLNMAPSSPPTSPQDGTMSTRWGNKNVDGGNEDDAATEKQRSVWTDSSKRKLSPRSSAPDGPTAADPFAGMKTCINYQQEIERLKTLVPKVENKKRSSQQQQHHHHQRNNSATMIITEGNMVDTDNNTNDSDIAVMADVSTTNTTNTTTTITTSTTTTTQSTLPSTDHDHTTTTSNISSSTTTGMTSVPSSSSSSSSSSHISSNSSSSSLSSSHDSMSSSSLSSACSPSSSIHSIIPPNSHSSVMSHEISPSTHSTSDHLIDLTPTAATTNHLIEPPNNITSPKMEKTTESSSVITDEEKTRFLEFMRSWTGGLNGWNDQPIDHKGLMWNQQRKPRLWTRSEPCSPLHHDVRMDPWSQHQQQHQHQQQQQQQQHHHHHHQYLQQQFHQQLPPTNIQLNMGHRQQPCFTPTSPPLQSPLSSKSLQQQPLLYPSSMHPPQKQQASFHHHQQQQYHHLHYHQLQQQQQQQQQQPHSLHFHQQQQPPPPPAPLASKGWHGSSDIKQVGTIGDRSSSPSVSRTTPRNHGPLSVSVM